MLLGSHFVSAQKTADSIIFWSANRKLTFADYKIVKDNTTLVGAKVAAITRTGIVYSLSAKNDGQKRTTLHITVRATVHRPNSFIKEKVLELSSQRKAELLNHEQKHFDISEIFTRQTIRDLQTLKLTKDFKNEIAFFVNERFKQAAAYQLLYDKETDNGENESAQAEWNKKIAEQLTELEKYKNEVVIRKIG